MTVVYRDWLLCHVCDVWYSLVYFVSAVGSPVCGFAIDKLGRNIFWLLSGVIVTIVCHGLLAFTFVSPFVPMVINFWLLTLRQHERLCFAHSCVFRFFICAHVNKSKIVDRSGSNFRSQWLLNKEKIDEILSTLGPLGHVFDLFRHTIILFDQEWPSFAQ